MSGRTFTADYDKTNIATRVWIPLGLAAVTGMTGLLAGVPGLSIIAAILTFVALRFWPLTRFDRPALKLSEDGVEIDGLGAVRWRDISDVRDGMVQVKAVKLPAIDLSFTRPIPDVFSATAATRLRPWKSAFSSCAATAKSVSISQSSKTRRKMCVARSAISCRAMPERLSAEAARFHIGFFSLGGFTAQHLVPMRETSEARYRVHMNQRKIVMLA